ncbi:MAG: hypothetical protein ACJARF_001478, partial [Alteromonadaceae bacterium]
GNNLRTLHGGRSSDNIEAKRKNLKESRYWQ